MWLPLQQQLPHPLSSRNGNSRPLISDANPRRLKRKFKLVREREEKNNRDTQMQQPSAEQISSALRTPLVQTALQNPATRQALVGYVGRYWPTAKYGPISTMVLNVESTVPVLNDFAARIVNDPDLSPSDRQQRERDLLSIAQPFVPAALAELHRIQNAQAETQREQEEHVQNEKERKRKREA